MKNNRLIFCRFCMLSFILLMIAGCSDENKFENYLDNNAYPPPVITLTSPVSLDEATFLGTQTLAGSITSHNRLRDVYATLLKKTETGYEEINKDKRVVYKLDSLPDAIDFSMDISITDENVAAIGLFATDIFTKVTEQDVVIKYIKGIPPTLSLTPASIDAVALDATTEISGTAASVEGIASITYNLVRKSPYLELHSKGNVAVVSTDKEKIFNFSVKVDDERAEAIEVIVTDSKGFSKTAYVEIKTITGVPAGKAAIFDDIEMAPEWENPTTSTQPYIFSVDGVSVNGVVKNVLSLQDATTAKSGSVDFMFANLYRNQTNYAFTANRGFAFVGAERLNGGPIGRQMDATWLTTMTKKIVYFKIIPQDMVATMNLDNFFATTTGNWQTFQTLNQLSAFVPETSNDKLLVQRLNASTSNTTAPVLQIVDGTYIAFKRQMTDLTFRYGIIKVVDAASDLEVLDANGKIPAATTGTGVSAYYTGPGLAGFDYTGVAKLYGQKCKLKIIIQK